MIFCKKQGKRKKKSGTTPQLDQIISNKFVFQSPKNIQEKFKQECIFRT